jgi:predicted  nucleic acid-binding Zn-ribbon protein
VGEPQLELEGIECTALEGNRAIVRLRGTWRGEHRSAGKRTILIVEADGRVLRFPAIPTMRQRSESAQDEFSARFALPARFVPQLERGAMVAVGEQVVEFPKLGGMPHGIFEEAGDDPDLTGPDVAGQEPPPPTRSGPGLARPEIQAPEAVQGAGSPPHRAPEVSSAPQGSHGAIAELRDELRRRATTEARLRGELVDLRTELSAHAAAVPRLDEMREALAAELERLGEYKRQEDTRRGEIESRAMVLAAELAEAQQQARELAGERDALRAQLRDGQDQLQAARASAEASTAEVAALQAELGRLEGELGTARAVLHERDSGLAEAESLLSQARALTASFTEE